LVVNEHQAWALIKKQQVFSAGLDEPKDVLPPSWQPPATAVRVATGVVLAAAAFP
jgi:hypothetical protein